MGRNFPCRGGHIGPPQQQAAHAQDSSPLYGEFRSTWNIAMWWERMRMPPCGLRPAWNFLTHLRSKPNGACRPGRNRPFSLRRNVASRLNTSAHGKSRQGRNREPGGAATFQPHGNHALAAELVGEESP